MKIRYTASLVFASSLIFLVACGNGDNGDDSPTAPQPKLVPAASALVFPENNTECNEGTVINDSESTVTFEWNASKNTDTYTLTVKDLVTGQTATMNSNTTMAEMTIQRGTPYEWFVVSKTTSSSETATSALWKFYNQGPGIENHAPFPAEAVSPKRGATLSQTNLVSLSWIGSDVDNDIKGYEVFFGTDINALESIGKTEMTSLSDVTISSGTVYYWSVHTTDNTGNISSSDSFEFKVE